MIIKFLLWGLLAYLGYAGVVFLLQRQIMFPRGLIPPPPPDAAKPADLERLWLTLPFGNIEAWYLPPQTPRQGPHPAAIFAHGNGELIDFWPDELAPLRRMGLALLLVEYPGYGRSGGRPSQKSISAAFTAAYDRLRSRPDIDAARIVLVGRSIGGGAACALAQVRPTAALVLMSTFVNVAAFAKNFLLPPLLIRDPFDNLAALKSYPGPVLIIHGRQDEVIPYRHSLLLHKAARNGKLVSYDCGHNDCLTRIGSFWQDVGNFLRQSGVLSDS